MTENSDVIFEEADGLGVITLNRPRSLNALTMDMLRRMDGKLMEWAGRGDIAAVLTRGAGKRAFCAGGDIKTMYQERPVGVEPAAFYRVEYAYNRRLFRFPKPHIALIDGVTLGGGLGVSVHGTHRVATERTVCAMPETGIGLFPDIGASHVLPRCPGRIGLYLALTGARLGAAECLYAGLATHNVPSHRLAELTAALASAPDRSRDGIDRLLARFAADPGAAPLAAMRTVIDRCFAADSVEEILVSLDRDGSQWARDTAGTMRAKSPTSLKIAFRQMREGAGLSFEECMKMEFRLAHHCMEGHDFYEGVRAAVIDKDNAPAWRPASLAEIRAADIDAYFAPVAHELTFPEPVSGTGGVET